MDFYIGLLIAIPVIGLIVGIIISATNKRAGIKLVEKREEIKFGMTKEEVLRIVGAEPREITQNKAKGTERYKWAAGQNYYTRSYSKGLSIGSSSHDRRYLIVVFKDNKVIEISTK